MPLYECCYGWTELTKGDANTVQTALEGYLFSGRVTIRHLVEMRLGWLRDDLYVFERPYEVRQKIEANSQVEAVRQFLYHPDLPRTVDLQRITAREVPPELPEERAAE